jgi:hypothetical protein
MVTTSTSAWRWKLTGSDAGRVSVLAMVFVSG